MLLGEFKRALLKHPDLTLRFQRPKGKFIAAHAHVTEVARVEKRFMDCGGELHSETVCRLQLWVAKDFWHRFTAGKLLAILNKAEPVLGSDDLEVDVEYESGVVTQSPVDAVSVIENELVLTLKERHTACLAKERSQAEAGRRLFRSWNPFAK